MSSHSSPRHGIQTSTTSSTVVASSYLHKLHGVEQPTQLHHCCVRSSIVFCSTRVGYQPSLPRDRDAAPLTLNRQAPPAQSEYPYANTEPSRALFTDSRLSVVGRTVMIPGVPRRYRRIDLMFLLSVSLARARLDEAFPISI